MSAPGPTAARPPGPPAEVVLEALGAALRERREIAVPASGFSMGPRWARTDALILRAHHGGPVPWGTVVVFRRGDRWLAHRVIARWGGRYLAKGDAVAVVDKPLVRPDEIEGVVAGYILDGRRHLLSPGGRPWAVARGLALAAWGWLRHGRRPPRRPSTPAAK